MDFSDNFAAIFFRGKEKRKEKKERKNSYDRFNGEKSANRREKKKGRR